MEIAQLVLDYLKVLIWPVLVGAIVFGFREQIRERIEALKEAKTPIAQATFFEKQAQGVQAKAEHAALSSASTGQEEPDAPAEEGPPSSDASGREAQKLEPRTVTAPREHWFAVAAGTVLEGADFSAAREIIPVDPDAAVMLAFREVEKVARAATVIGDMEPLSRPETLRQLTRRMAGSLGSELVGVAEELSQLRNSVTHGQDTVTPNGAVSFVAACEELARAIASTGASKLRHPSRSDAVQRLLREAGLLPEG
ncbi:hypothetical protein [Nocardioides sp. GXQ0305]|uniref:hypothetical protein n=1 Tax=Nocardioides sp. GXQ0305 TaxID=3423912 RepID=UPI003D7F1822